MLKSEINWTNSSVKQLSGDDPIERIVSLARKVILGSSDSGIKGPPFDPFEIAKYMGIQVLPSNDVPDARTVPLPCNKFLIEYNPNQPKGRTRFSIAHELSHTLFPDCANYIRNRERPKRFASDRWQLEMLCNMGASEFLMPIGSFPNLAKEEISIGNLMDLCAKYDVSSEALFLRVIRLTAAPCFAFCATRIDPDNPASRYVIDYIVYSKSWGLDLPKNLLLPQGSIIRNCTAVGYKQMADETWGRKLGQFHVECVGIPPYPSHRYPRVLGIVTKSEVKKRDVNSIDYRFGDATEPLAKGNFIIAHVVNDQAQRWGGRGFVKFLKSKWPAAEKAYVKWRQQNPKEFTLGAIHKFDLDDHAKVVSMIAQRGYGPSDTPRIRYTALKTCLQKVAQEALSNSASVHMPRIGSGQARGSWSIISELIEEELCGPGVKVIVYDLPPNGDMQMF